VTEVATRREVAAATVDGFTARVELDTTVTLSSDLTVVSDTKVTAGYLTILDERGNSHGSSFLHIPVDLIPAVAQLLASAASVIVPTPPQE